MTFLSLSEIFQLVILTVAIGYILSGFIQRPKPSYELHPWFDWDDIKFAALIAAPAVILHEFGHKFIAMAFGLDATFSIWPAGLVIGIVLKLVNSPLLLLAPAYVSFSNATALQTIVIAFAGPGVNLLLWGISAFVLRKKRHLTQKQLVGWAISKKLNMYLFFFNMIPLPPLDGFKVVSGIIGLL